MKIEKKANSLLKRNCFRPRRILRPLMIVQRYTHVDKVQYWNHLVIPSRQAVDGFIVF